MTLAITLFSVGLLGFVLNRRHVLLALLSIELMLLAITYLFLIESHTYDDILGLSMGLYAIVIAGAESAIGLALVVAYHRSHGEIFLD